MKISQNKFFIEYQEQHLVYSQTVHQQIYRMGLVTGTKGYSQRTLQLYTIQSKYLLRSTEKWMVEAESQRLA